MSGGSENPRAESRDIMVVMGRRTGVGVLLLVAVGAGCGTEESGVSDGGQADAVTTVPENTAARCQDGIDNDGDGVTDCQDPDCWALSFCLDAGVKDGPPVDGPAIPFDTGGDVSQLLDGFQDADGPQTDLSGGSCKAHCDCPQGQFCYYGNCLTDPKMPVYCCTKTGCPPGRWCFETSGAKGACAESTTHPCQDACDCGPAHCCKKDPSKPATDPGHCVKDTKDPWDPGGVVVGTLGGCEQGTDATYCCEDPMCHAGRHAFSTSSGVFTCYDDKSGSSLSHCTGKSCFGTVCNCDPGESCLDTSQTTPVLGKTCFLLSGGSCVSNAVVEAVYGFSPTDLLPCCSAGCLSGQKCEVGWRNDTEYAYSRVVGVCGGTCGNGSCDPGEGESSCAADCAAKCGNGSCDIGESPTTCSTDCGKHPGCKGVAAGSWITSTICGDGVCQGGKTCDWTEPESCRTCPQDCGACEWEMVHGQHAWVGTQQWLQSAWGSSATDVFVVGGGVVVHFDGAGWAPMMTWAKTSLNDVWGSSSTNVIAVGSAGTVLRYDGSTWKPMTSGTTAKLTSVWGTSASDVFAVGGGGKILHYDGTSWTPMTSGTTAELAGVWGSSGSNVFAVGGSGTILRYDGTSWTPMTSGTTTGLSGVWASGSTVFAVGGGGTILLYDGASWQNMTSNATTDLKAVWGSSATNVFAVGQHNSPSEPRVLRYDGTSWQPVSSGTTAWLAGVWGSSATDVFVVGWNGTVLHHDGASWKKMKLAPTDPGYLLDAWGSSGSDVFAVGQSGRVLHFDGTSWKPMASGTKGELSGIWGSSGSDVFTVGNPGTVLHYDGASWTPMTSGTTEWLSDVWGSSGTDVYAVGPAGTLLHYDGTSWQKITTGTTAHIRGVWASSATDVFAVAWYGPLLHYDGTSWTTMISGKKLNAVWGSSATDVFAAGGTGLVLHHDGAGWTSMNTGVSNPLSGVWGTSGSDVFAVGIGPTIVHYDGTSWSVPRVDLREPGLMVCRHLYGIGGTTTGELFILGSVGLILRHCPGGVCP